MKAKIYGLMFLLGVGGLCCSCEKDLEKYSGTDYIRFTAESAKDSVDYCFGLAGKTDADRIGIEVKITGEVRDYDRDFTVKVNALSTAKEGQHFRIAGESCRVRANRTVDTLWIDVMNRAELRSGRVYLQLDLMEDNHFKLCFPENNSSKIYLTDKVERPAWWDSWHETNGLGMYSEKKYRLFVRISGVSDLGDSVAYPERREAILKFKYYLIDEAAQGRTVVDEDGQPMSVEMYG